ncbi:MAG: dihydropteroate synthase [Proteobacteria bacterium]|nr:dihydropteroate synthase [Pseudomonadota bacterium]
MKLQCGGRLLDLTRPVVMGVLNVTPNSFSDGGRFIGRDAALAQADVMVGEGAAIIDVGGESTRPGAESVPLQQELDRVIPVIEALAGRIDVVVSIDTLKPDVMRAAEAAGAGLINDVMALRGAGSLAAAAAGRAAVCLMHMQGEPRTMQAAPHYVDVVTEVDAFLRERVQACIDAGIDRSRLCVDPGFGFGKTLDHNLALLAALQRLCVDGVPLLAGLSRKSMLGTLTGRPVEQRVHASVAAATAAVLGGARIVRAHDVAATRDALRVAEAIVAARQSALPAQES